MKSQIIKTTVSSANQTAVPSSVRDSLGLEAGDKIYWIIDKKSGRAMVKPAPKNWGKYMLGLGKKVWEDIDTDKYIDSLREDRDK